MDIAIEDTQESKVLHIVGDKCIKIESGLVHQPEKVYGPFDIYQLCFHPEYTLISAYSGDISLLVNLSSVHPRHSTPQFISDG